MRGINCSYLYVYPDDFDNMGKWGVRIVRYQVNSLVAKEVKAAAYPAFIDRVIAKIDAALPNLAAANIRLVLCLYPPPGGNIPGSSPHAHKIFKSVACMNALIAAWDKLAAHYAHNPAIWGYDLLGEPAYNKNYYNAACLKWPDLASQLITTVLAYDPTKTIILEPIYGDGNQLGSLSTTLASHPAATIYLSPHIYLPTKFTCQRTSSQYPKTISWNTGRFSKTMLINQLANTKSLAQGLGKPVFVGEFGAVKWAPGSASWLSDMTSLLDSWGWSGCIQIYREYPGWNLEMTDDTGTTYSPVDTDRMKIAKAWWAKGSF